MKQISILIDFTIEINPNHFDETHVEPHHFKELAGIRLHNFLLDPITEKEMKARGITDYDFVGTAKIIE